MKQDIVIAIKGALSKFGGFGDYIASSAYFAGSTADVAAINKIDEAFEFFYDQYPEGFHDAKQLYVFPARIANRNCILIIRGKKRYTQFPENNRYYDRREYFYFPLDDYRSVDVVWALPEMKQYAGKEIGNTERLFNIRPFDQPKQKDTFEKLALSLLNRTPCILSVLPDKPDANNIKLLSAVNCLPDSYLRYIGYGFNLSTDPFAGEYLHAYTTILQGHEIENPVLVNGYNSFIKELYTKRPQYPNTEVELIPDPDPKNRLYDLIGYQFLHFEIEHILSGDSEDSQRIFHASKNYLRKFVKHINEREQYILRRIMRIYQYWRKRGPISDELFSEFWEAVAPAKLTSKVYIDFPFLIEDMRGFIRSKSSQVKELSILEKESSFWSKVPAVNHGDASVMEEIGIAIFEREDKLTLKGYEAAASFQHKMSEKGIKLINDLQDKLDIDRISPDEALSMVRQNPAAISNELLLQLGKKAGPGKLLESFKSDAPLELLQDKVRSPVFKKLLAELSVEDLLSWANFYKEADLRLPVDYEQLLISNIGQINQERDLGRFVAIEKILTYSSAHIDKVKIIEFIHSILSKERCHTFGFFKAAMTIAALYSLKISVAAPPSDFEGWNDLYQLFLQRATNISNFAGVMGDVKKQIREHVLRARYPVEQIFQLQALAGDKLHGEVPFFQELLLDSFSKDETKREGNLIVWLSQVTRQGQNHFLPPPSPLYKYLMEENIGLSAEGVAQLREIEQQIKNKKGTEMDPVKLLLARLISFNASNTRQAADESSKFKILLKNKGRLFANSLLVLFVCAALAVAIFFYNSVRQKDEAISRKADSLSMLITTIRQQSATINQLQDSIHQSNKGIAPLLPVPNMLIPLKGLHGNHLSLAAILDKIYDANPKNVQAHYSAQRKAYGQFLIKLNKSCFDHEVCLCDSLPKIPGYKKPD